VARPCIAVPELVRVLGTFFRFRSPQFLAGPAERVPPVSNAILHRPWPFSAPVCCRLVYSHHSVRSFVTSNCTAVLFTLRHHVTRLACACAVLFFRCPYLRRALGCRCTPHSRRARFPRTPVFLNVYDRRRRSHINIRLVPSTRLTRWLPKSAVHPVAWIW